MRLEQAAYAAMGREEGLAKKLQRGWIGPSDGRIRHDRYQEARKETRAAIDRYEAMQLLQLW